MIDRCYYFRYHSSITTSYICCLGVVSFVWTHCLHSWRSEQCPYKYIYAFIVQWPLGFFHQTISDHITTLDNLLNELSKKCFGNLYGKILNYSKGYKNSKGVIVRAWQGKYRKGVIILHRFWEQAGVE